MNARLTDKSQFENIVIRANPDGSFVRLHDVGRIELGHGRSPVVEHRRTVACGTVGLAECTTAFPVLTVGLSEHEFVEDA